MITMAKDFDYAEEVVKWRLSLSDQDCIALHADFKRGMTTPDVVDGALEYNRRRARGQIKIASRNPSAKLTFRCDRHKVGHPGGCRECRRLNQLPEIP